MHQTKKGNQRYFGMKAHFGVDSRTKLIHAVVATPANVADSTHDAAWCDEIASWRYPEAWDMLMFGLRLGPDPRVVVTTTPKPIKIIRELIADPTTVITRGSTYDNRANLAPAFMAQIIKKYEGTRLGRQELNAEVLDDVPGALWSRERIDETRWAAHQNVPELIRVVVAIDPAASHGEEADETGIIVAGKDRNGHGCCRPPNGPSNGCADRNTRSPARSIRSRPRSTH